jgi:hypothetical protein
MNRKRSISRKQKRARHRNKQQALRAARHLTLGDEHDTDRKAAEAMRTFPIVPRLKQPAFPREREFGFVGHYIDGSFIIQAGDDFVAMNVAYKKDAWYLRHDKRRNRKPRPTDTGLVETNLSLSSGLAHVLASMIEAGKLELAQELALTVGKTGMAELKRRTGYDPAYMTLHPDSYGTLSFHYGLWPVDREKRCPIGRSAGGKRGRRGLRSLGHAFISLMRHHDAIGLPEDLIWQAKEKVASRDRDDWEVSVVMDCKLREALMKLPNGKELLERADEFQRAAAKDWLERFHARAAGVAALKRERDEAVEKMEKRKKAAERLVLMRTRRAEEEKRASEAARERERETVDSIRGELAEKDRAIVAALQQLGAPAEIAESERCGALIQRAEQVVIERDQAVQAQKDAESENEKRGQRLEEARQKTLALEKEVTRLGRIAETAMKLVEALSAKALNLGKKASGLLEELSISLGRPAKRKQDRDAPEANLPA